MEFSGEVLQPHEVRFVERMVTGGERLEWHPRDVQRRPSHDFRWTSCGDIDVEVKSTKPKWTTIRGRISDSVRRARRHDFVKENFIVDIGESDLSEELRDQAGTYNVERSRTAIRRLWIMSRGTLHEIELREP